MSSAGMRCLPCGVREGEEQGEESSGRGRWRTEPSLALCNLIRAQQREAGLCGPATCRPSAPHGGDWAPVSRERPGRGGGPFNSLDELLTPRPADTGMRLTDTSAGAAASYCGLRQSSRCSRRWCPRCLLKDSPGLSLAFEHPLWEEEEVEEEEVAVSMLVSRGKPPAGSVMATPSPAAQSAPASALWGETGKEDYAQIKKNTTGFCCCV